MTLGDLLKDKTLPVKVRLEHWKKGEYFYAHYILDGSVYGNTQDGTPDRTTLTFQTNSYWELYEEPKQKVTKYLWAYEGEYGHPKVSKGFYKNINDLLRHEGTTDCGIVRLDWTATEFEE